MMGRYVLDHLGLPVEEPSLLAWGRWMAGADRCVARANIGDVSISTVFLGIDHGWSGRPVLWETMIFGGEHNNYQKRYHTRTEALMGHKRAFEMVRASEALPNPTPKE